MAKFRITLTPSYMDEDDEMKSTYVDVESEGGIHLSYGDLVIRRFDGSVLEVFAQGNWARVVRLPD